MTIDHETDQIIFQAFRYALGRRTGVVSTTCDYLTRYWDQLEPRTRNQIAEETLTAINRGHAGSDCDVEQWLRVLKLHGEHNCDCKWTTTGWAYRPGCEYHDKAKWPANWSLGA